MMNLIVVYSEVIKLNEIVTKRPIGDAVHRLLWAFPRDYPRQFYNLKYQQIIKCISFFNKPIQLVTLVTKLHFIKEKQKLYLHNNYLNNINTRNYKNTYAVYNRSLINVGFAELKGKPLNTSFLLAPFWLKANIKNVTIY
jgi:hypothetical protein